MPSIPQSLLWISLVVLWLFVLVPMLVSKRDAVRRTSDVALAARVLNSRHSARLLRRRGPAAGHHSDPDWRPAEDQLGDEPLDDEALDDEPLDEVPTGDGIDPAVGPEMETDSGAEASDDEGSPDDGTEDGYEYVPDSSGIEPAVDAEPAGDPIGAGRRRRYESKTAEAVRARKYLFRKRMVTAMAMALLASGVLAYLVAPWAWSVCGAVGAVTALYLGYLRRQTRIEEQLRRRRAQRIHRARLGVQNTHEPELDVVPARLRRPGAAVLEIDDEDPIFEHLDEVAFARHFDLPKAAGQ